MDPPPDRFKSNTIWLTHVVSGEGSDHMSLTVFVSNDKGRKWRTDTSTDLKPKRRELLHRLYGKDPGGG